MIFGLVVSGRHKLRALGESFGSSSSAVAMQVCFKRERMLLEFGGSDWYFERTP